MNAYHVTGQARFKNGQSKHVDLHTQSTSGEAALSEVKAHLNARGHLHEFDLHSLAYVGEALVPGGKK